MQSNAKDVTDHIKEAPAERQPERIDFHVAESMLRATVKSTGPVC